MSLTCPFTWWQNFDAPCPSKNMKGSSIFSIFRKLQLNSNSDLWLRWLNLKFVQQIQNYKPDNYPRSGDSSQNLCQTMKREYLVIASVCMTCEFPSRYMNLSSLGRGSPFQYHVTRVCGGLASPVHLSSTGSPSQAVTPVGVRLTIGASEKKWNQGLLLWRAFGAETGHFSAYFMKFWTVLNPLPPSYGSIYSLDLYWSQGGQKSV